MWNIIGYMAKNNQISFVSKIKSGTFMREIVFLVKISDNYDSWFRISKTIY